MQINGKKMILLISVLTAGLVLSSCSSAAGSDVNEGSSGALTNGQESVTSGSSSERPDDAVRSAGVFRA
ncbi:MAG: hypothetical protein K6A38_07475 [Lachnospiraceae bacterium]|nr:hypothetical protein [Lachnospiraceae bacterium]